MTAKPTPLTRRVEKNRPIPHIIWHWFEPGARNTRGKFRVAPNDTARTRKMKIDIEQAFQNRAVDGRIVAWRLTLFESTADIVRVCCTANIKKQVLKNRKNLKHWRLCFFPHSARVSESPRSLTSVSTRFLNRRFHSLTRRPWVSSPFYWVSYTRYNP